MSMSRLVSNVVIGFLVIAITVLSYVLWVYFIKEPTPTSVSTEEVVEVEEKDAARGFTDEDLYQELLGDLDTTEALSGQIMVVSALRAEQQQALPAVKLWDSFSLNVASGVITKNTTDETLYFLNKHDTTNAYLYTGRPSKADSQGIRYNTSLYYHDGVVERKINSYESENPEVFTRLRIPRWSQSGNAFLYNAQTWNDEKAPDSFADISQWEVSIGERNGDSFTTEFFAKGYNPVFVLNDTYIAYLKKDGVYAKRYVPGADHSKEKEFLVISQQMATRDHVGISNNGKYLALTRPVTSGHASIDIHRLTLDSVRNLVSAQRVKRISLDAGENGFWPLFSPSGRYVSFQVSRTDKTKGNSITIYDLVDDKIVKNIDFSAYDFEMSFNTDWVSSFDIQKIAP